MIGRMRIICIALGLVFVTGPSRIAPAQQNKKQVSESIARQLAQLPIVDYTDDNETDRVRTARNDRHNVISKYGIRKPKLQENMRTDVLDLTVSHPPIPPALPIASEVIAIGTVQELQAFLSSDRGSIYSEITLTIEEVLKGNERLTVGLEATIKRNGGGVRFASGKTLRRAAIGFNMPIVGHRYLVFLNSIQGDDSFSLVTGYDFVDNKVMPLDGIGWIPEDDSFKSYQVYRNVPVSKLLDDLKKALRE